jgi:formyl-CoA transferase
MDLPLSGVTVVAVEQAVAAPLASRHLADLGARVIKVERVDGGDFARDYDHVVHGTGAHFVWLNRGKESIAVDLKTAEGRDVVRRLVDRADVFVQNLAPGAAARLGFAADVLRAAHPELVVVDLSGFGTGGPMDSTSPTTCSCRRGRPRLDHRHPGDPGEDGRADRGHRRRHVLLPGGPRGAAAPVAHRRGRHHRGVHARGDGGVDGLPALQPAVHRRAAPPDGAQPRLDRPVRRVPDAGRSGAHRRAERQRLAHAGHRRPRRTAARDDPRFATNVQRVRHRADCDAAVAARTSTWTSVRLAARLVAPAFRPRRSRTSTTSSTIRSCGPGTGGARSGPSTAGSPPCCHR